VFVKEQRHNYIACVCQRKKLVLL